MTRDYVRNIKKIAAGGAESYLDDDSLEEEFEPIDDIDDFTSQLQTLFSNSIESNLIKYSSYMDKKRKFNNKSPLFRRTNS